MILDDAGWTDKASRNPEERRLYEDRADYLTAYALHTDLRVRRDGAALAIGGDWEQHGLRQRDFLIEHGLERTHSLLDLGCGTGRLARRIVPWLDTGRSTGIDISAEAIGHARRLSAEEGWAARKPELMLGNGTLGAVRGRRFDMIWAHSVFTHLPADLIEGVIAGLGALEFGAFYFTWKRHDRPRRSGLKQFQYPFAFFTETAARHGCRAREVNVDWPQGQRTGLLER